MGTQTCSWSVSTCTSTRPQEVIAAVSSLQVVLVGCLILKCVLLWCAGRYVPRAILMDLVRRRFVQKLVSAVAAMSTTSIYCLGLAKRFFPIVGGCLY